MLVSGMAAVCPGRGGDGFPVRGFRGRFRDAGRESFPAGIWRHGGDGEVLGDDTAGPGRRERGPLDGELAAALAGPAEQFAGLAAWAAGEAGSAITGSRRR